MLNSKHKKTTDACLWFLSGIKKAERVISRLKCHKCLFTSLLAIPPQKRMGTRIPIGGHFKRFTGYNTDQHNVAQCGARAFDALC